MNAPLLARNGALTIAFALCCLFGRTVAGGDSYLFATGPRIFAYNISTLILAICYVLSAFSLGSRVIGSARFRVADRFVIGAASGFAVLNIVGQGVGMVGLLNQTVSTILICAPLLFLPPVSRSVWSFLQENKGYILFFSALSLYIFCFSALLRNENSGDFVFYLPTYEKIVQSGSTLPNLSFLGYCYVKGFGAAHLLMAATSQYSVQYLSAACILLKAVTQYSSIDRYMLFGIVINRLVIATALFVGGAALYRFASTRIRIPIPFGKLVFAAFVVLSLHAAISNKLPDTPRQITYTRHFLGLAPFAETFWWLRDPAAEKVLTLLPQGTRVMPLYPALYAAILPRVIFELSDTTDTTREADTLYLSPDPAEAARTYIRLGLRHFMIDLDGMIMPYPGYGAVFRPEYLADHFRARHLTGKRWLLTLEGTDADGIRPDRNFMQDYARGYARALTNPRNAQLNTLKAWARNQGVDFRPPAAGWPPMSRNDPIQGGDPQ